MIYLDASALLARLFSEDQYPAESVWRQPLVASRLIQYEVWNRVHAHANSAAHLRDAEQLLSRVDMVELGVETLARALKPFPVAVRTLDAFHLATIEFLRGQGQQVELLSYDKRMLAAAKAMQIPVFKA